METGYISMSASKNGWVHGGLLGGLAPVSCGGGGGEPERRGPRVAGRAADVEPADGTARGAARRGAVHPPTRRRGAHASRREPAAGGTPDGRVGQRRPTAGRRRGAPSGRACADRGAARRGVRFLGAARGGPASALA